MVNKKKGYIFLGITVLFLVFSILSLFVKHDLKFNNNSNSVVSKKFTPEFLTSEEKKNFRLADDLKVQVISRNQEGEITVYKIINDNNDVVNPDNIEPIR